jgi:hypothetical protein
VRQSISPQVQRVCAWLGPAMVVGFLIGCIPIGGFIPPTDPPASAERIADFYRDDTTAIRIGCLIMIISLTLIVPWGAVIAARTYRQEAGFPIFTFAQVACLGVATFVVIAIPMFWAIAAFRPDDVDPGTTRTLHDIAWYLFLYTWPPFSAWCICIAVPIFRAEPGQEAFPRWIAYLNLWVALLLFPAGLMSFFKTGPFSYEGLFAMYMPLTVFFIWMIAMSVATIQGANRDETRAATPESAAKTEPEGVLAAA